MNTKKANVTITINPKSHIAKFFNKKNNIQPSFFISNNRPKYKQNNYIPQKAQNLVFFSYSPIDIKNKKIISIGKTGNGVKQLFNIAAYLTILPGL